MPWHCLRSLWRLHREAALELLVAVNDLWRLARTKGPLALEPHFERPRRSLILWRHRGLRRLPWLGCFQHLCENIR
ncbi:MAG: hypothetical protein HQL40_07540 [Alphaproteobacteria bacterium]|nr:hypothetical protein [Alphaproteobacteria bacterium]